jgi:hypothetical protein
MTKVEKVKRKRKKKLRSCGGRRSKRQRRYRSREFRGFVADGSSHIMSGFSHVSIGGEEIISSDPIWTPGLKTLGWIWVTQAYHAKSVDKSTVSSTASTPATRSRPKLDPANARTMRLSRRVLA